jgi:hypothetical protein
LCVTSITVSCAGDQGTYFDLIVGDDEGEALDFVFRVYVPALTSLTFPFPTPLVLRRDQPWVLTVEPLIKDGLFQTMLVGYVSEERPALRPFRDTAGPARETTPVDRRLDELERENMDLREKLAEATRDRPIK